MEKKNLPQRNPEKIVYFYRVTESLTTLKEDIGTSCPLIIKHDFISDDILVAQKVAKRFYSRRKKEINKEDAKYFLPFVKLNNLKKGNNSQFEIKLEIIRRSGKTGYESRFIIYGGETENRIFHSHGQKNLILSCIDYVCR